MIVFCLLIEVNFGDGFFLVDEYLVVGGCFVVGIDFNVCVSLCGEFELFEYG